MESLGNKDLDLKKLKISDLIDINLLQRFQDNFAIGMDIASVTVDINGEPVTKPSSYTSFCTDFTHSTSVGDSRCAQSHKRGGEEAARTGRPYVYTCHAGLIDFAAPITVSGIQIGTILGGQILTAAPDEKGFRKTADEIGVSGDGYVEAANKVKITDKKNIEAAAEVLFIVANALSNIGFEQLKLRSVSANLSHNFSNISHTMDELAHSSSEVLKNQHELNEEIDSVKNISKEINSILDSIKAIADQTNMLGLNASIEAARAGESGKGFSVVATEIRALSQNSKETAVKIKELTTKIQESVEATIKTSSKTMETTENQSSKIEKTMESIMEVSDLAKELGDMSNMEY